MHQPKKQFVVSSFTKTLASLLLMSASVSAATAEEPPEKINWQDKGWELIWQDEFDGTSVDMTKWSYVVDCWGGGNNEKQCYVDKSDNFEFNNGIMHIVAKREDFTGPADIQDSDQYDPSNTRTQPYTSGRLRTKHKGDWRYGRFEMRARMPHGQGTWPAFWMLPTNPKYGTWAASGEIDIMEAVNLGAKTDEGGKLSNRPEARIHGTLHYGAAWPNNTYSGYEYAPPGGFNPATAFHTYAVEWEEGEIRWYVDDVHYATQTSKTWFSEYTNENGEKVRNPGHAPFDQPFHLIVNLAVGGNWAAQVNEKGVNEEIFPQRLSVDYIRVYQCSKDPETGKGCASISEDAKVVSHGHGQQFENN